jgi:hypothetical protein
MRQRFENLQTMRDDGFPKLDWNCKTTSVKIRLWKEGEMTPQINISETGLITA